MLYDMTVLTDVRKHVSSHSLWTLTISIRNQPPRPSPTQPSFHQRQVNQLLVCLAGVKAGAFTCVVSVLDRMVR